MTIADLVKEWPVKPDIDLLRFVKKVQGHSTVHHVHRESQHPALFYGNLHTVYFHNPGRYVVQAYTSRCVLNVGLSLSKPAALLVRAYDFLFDKREEQIWTPGVIAYSAGIRESYEEAIKLIEEHPETAHRRGILEMAGELKKRQDAMPNN